MNSVYRAPTIDDYLKAPALPRRKTGGRRSVARQEVDSELPLVTVLSVVLNSRELLLQTVESVLKQTYPNIEYIVIDGASTDGTLDVIREFDDKIDLWISEPDRGTADAFNKAVSLARGEFVFWLSAGDWIDADFIETAVEALLSSGADFVFGRTTLYKNGTPDFVLEGDRDYAKSITVSPRVNHATWVMKRECFEKVGLFDTSYKIAGDYEWGLRLYVQGGRGFYDRRLNVHFRGGGITERYYIRRLLDVLRALKRHGMPRTRATVAILYAIMRSMVRHLAKLILPDSVYQKLVRVVRRRYVVPLD